jgi:hypothetical protein
MNSREFFFAVANMRELQKEYFQTHDRKVFLACRAAENAIDSEIKRVKAIIDNVPIYNTPREKKRLK